MTSVAIDQKKKKTVLDDAKNYNVSQLSRTFFVQWLCGFQFKTTVWWPGIEPGTWCPGDERADPSANRTRCFQVRVLAVLLACLAGQAGQAWARCGRGSRGALVPGRGPGRRVARQATAHAPKYDARFITEYLAGEYERKASEACNRAITAEWNYITDLGNSTKEEIYNQASLDLAAFEKDEWEKYFRDQDPEEYSDPVVRRQVEFLLSLGVSALNETELKDLNGYELRMQNLYSTAKICPYGRQACDLDREGHALDPEIETVMARSRDYDELAYTWKAWHDASGKNMREDYKGYVELQNKAARSNDFEDMGQMWQAGFETDYFYEDMMDLWDQVFPLYEQLHAYVRGRLRAFYGDKMGADDGLIPAHILGNMWGQSWINVYDLVEPFPNATSYDVTKALRDQHYNPLKMFRKSDEFYTSMGLLSSEMSYGERAVIQKPRDREIICHGSAWDFCDRKDFRIKMCTKVHQDDFRTIHHEMGHIQYYLQYKHQPYMLRSGANPGFHEAIGDTIALSVDNPKHLKAIGLLRDYDDSDEGSVNALMKMALEKVAFLPFGLLVDMWRWDVFAGNVSTEDWNRHWWYLREDIQGLRPPVPRSEEDFDPGAKFHVPGSYQYISYFVADILQFQLYRALCIEAGEYRPDDPTSPPLHKCDFYNSKEAGVKFSKGMALGASVHWREALEELTGETELNATALLEYFEPLHRFLREANGDLEQPSADSSSRSAAATLQHLLPALPALLLMHVILNRYERS
ncbi:hypothetical protein ONE63_003708 [Megalurothrips usitatus]|uniref:Angiotensin-converting enzyme n=1 Tax=Megalurothrips usitatus TaxID=439358 RepID=A0AAV7XAD1_9NEOP|nr:hypothetical protein ONE63_003708 [Megalurothrips usitatus]